MRHESAWCDCRSLLLTLTLLIVGSHAMSDDGEKGKVAPREIVTKVAPAVVTIEIPGIGLGSGFFVDDSGAVITNFHVIAGATEATVVLHDGSRSKVVGFSELSLGRDLAVLRVEKPQVPFGFLTLARAAPQPGDSVLVFGAPKAMRGSVTDGIVSAIRSGKDVRDILKQSAGSDIYTESLGFDLDARWIQTTAPISAGNSGGPLVNQNGEVVGITTWSEPDSQNLNFAISAEHARELIRNATLDSKPLSSLPAPRPALRASLKKGDGKRTLEYWNERARIEANAFANLRRPKVFKNPELIAKFGDAYYRAANTYTFGVRKLDIANVDGELVEAVNAEVLNVERNGLAWRKHIEAVRAQNSAMQVQTNNEISAAADRSPVVRQRFADLRRILSERYGVPFPHYETLPAKELMVAKQNERAAGELTLARELLKHGKSDSARGHLKTILKAYPLSDAAAEAVKMLKGAGTSKEEDELIASYERMSEAMRVADRGHAHMRKGELDRALSDFSDAIRMDPQYLFPYNARAWILATAEDAKYRDGKSAVASATKACELCNWADAAVLDTLAAAYAESEDFDNAIRWQVKALAKASEIQRDELQSRLDLYRSGRPYREAQMK